MGRDSAGPLRIPDPLVDSRRTGISFIEGIRAIAVQFRVTKRLRCRPDSDVWRVLTFCETYEGPGRVLIKALGTKPILVPCQRKCNIVGLDRDVIQLVNLGFARNNHLCHFCFRLFHFEILFKGKHGPFEKYAGSTFVNFKSKSVVAKYILE